MWKRVAAVAVGLLMIMGGIVGQPSPAARIQYVLYGLGAVCGGLAAWLRYRGQDEPLTWKPVAGWSALGSGLSGLVAGGVAEGLGAGVVMGLMLALVNYGLRGPLPDQEAGEEGSGAGSSPSAG